MTGEGSLDAPTRQIIDWQNPDFADPAKLDEEMRRVFDICHGCRRCFNLCDSFPRLFDLIDESPQEDVEHLAVEDFKPVVEACTLCDMCFMTKCPYVPPHPFMLDFPHLMLRHRFVEAKDGKTDFVQKQLAEMDRNGSAARFVAPLVNWASDKDNSLTRGLMEKTVAYRRQGDAAEIPCPHLRVGGQAAGQRDQHGRAGLRQAQGGALCHLLRQLQQARDRHGCARRAEPYRRRNQGRLSRLLRHALPGTGRAGARGRRTPRKVSAELVKLIDDGYDIVALTASAAG